MFMLKLSLSPIFRTSVDTLDVYGSSTIAEAFNIAVYHFILQKWGT